MKILVISDTHGEIRNVDYIMAYYAEEIDVIVHCGDYIKDAEKLEEKYPELDIYKVPGNCDLMNYMKPMSSCIELEGVKMFITHGHRHHVKYDYQELIIDAKAHDAKVVVFGHTHIACQTEEEGVVLVNPGSLSLPRDMTVPSFAIVEINNGIIEKIEINNILSEKEIRRHPSF